jgi:hypothetical protein
VIPPLAFRLGINFVAGGLLMAALAYDWLGNLMHEIIGTAMFALLMVHNIFNRRWYARASKGGHSLRGWVYIVGVLALLATMLVLLTTSILISRNVFSFLAFNGGYVARQIHGSVAYWALVIVSVHIGMRWSVVMGVINRLLRSADTNARTNVLLQLLAAGIAAYGVHSSLVIGMGTRLLAEITLNFWDFDQATLKFFLHIVSIAGLYICVTHYSMRLISVRR